MKIEREVQKSCDWFDFCNSTPVKDVADTLSEYMFNQSNLKLTPESIGLLLQHPDTLRCYKHDWKYHFQVDEVSVSTNGTDYLEIEV